MNSNENDEGTSVVATTRVSSMRSRDTDQTPAGVSNQQELGEVCCGSIFIRSLRPNHCQTSQGATASTHTPRYVERRLALNSDLRLSATENGLQSLRAALALGVSCEAAIHEAQNDLGSAITQSLVQESGRALNELLAAASLAGVNIRAQDRTIGRPYSEAYGLQRDIVRMQAAVAITDHRLDENEDLRDQLHRLQQENRALRQSQERLTLASTEDVYRSGQSPSSDSTQTI